MEGFDEAVGTVLRLVRRARALTLRDVEKRSGAVFKASVLGSYERGERSISLRRFWELAHLYGIPPDRLLTEAANRMQPVGRREVVIDLNRLALVEELARGAVASFTHEIKTMRADYLSDVIALRSADVETLSYELGVLPRVLLQTLGPALLSDRGRKQPSR